MKKMSVKKEILTIGLIIVTILAIGSQVLATGTENSPVQIPIINTTTNALDTDVQTNQTPITVTPTNVVTPTTNTTVITYQNNTTLPQTGDASDYAIFMLIVVAALVAVYAYKKVKDYNIK